MNKKVTIIVYSNSNNIDIETVNSAEKENPDNIIVEIKDSPIAALISALPSCGDIIGFLPSGAKYLAGKLSCCLPLFDDNVGLVYNDCITYLNGTPVTIYRNSFQNNYGCPLFRKDLISQLSENISLKDIYNQIVLRSIALHVPKVLMEEIEPNVKSRT